MDGPLQGHKDKNDARDMTMLLFCHTNTVLFPHQFIVLPLNNTLGEIIGHDFLKLPEIKKNTLPVIHNKLTQ